MKRIGYVFIILIMMGIVVSTSGCISSDADSSDDLILVEEGKFYVGTEAQFPPFEIRTSDGGFYGFDIAMAEALGEEMGLEVVFIDTDFASIIASLNADKFDVAISAMTITAERAESVNFSDAYFEAGLSLAVPFDSDITSVEDLDGKTIGVQLGTTGDIYASELENVTVKRYAHAPDAFMDMKNGNLDAVVNDDVVSQPYVAQYPNDFKIIEGLLTVEEYGIAIPKDNPVLLQMVNDALQALRDNGTYDEIFDEYIVNWSSP